jgi:hypothetical protein
MSGPAVIQLPCFALYNTYSALVFISKHWFTPMLPQSNLFLLREDLERTVRKIWLQYEKMRETKQKHVCHNSAVQKCLGQKLPQL